MSFSIRCHSFSSPFILSYSFIYTRRLSHLVPFLNYTASLFKICQRKSCYENLKKKNKADDKKMYICIQKIWLHQPSGIGENAYTNRSTIIHTALNCVCSSGVIFIFFYFGCRRLIEMCRLPSVAPYLGV